MFKCYKIIIIIMYMDKLIVYKTEFDKARVGRLMDGGYVINRLPGNYDILISGGVGDDISFEKDFLIKYPNIKCLAFDGTSSLDINENDIDNIELIKKNIGNTNNNLLTNLHNEIEPYNDIFLKLDIEGHEFRVLPTFSKTQMKKFKQIVLEIHTPFDIEKYPEYFKGLSDVKLKHLFEMLEKLNETHTLVHFHGNNGCLMNFVDKIPLPHVFEVTYVRNDIIKKKERNDVPFPTQFDCPNKDDNPEYILDGFPYCCKY